MSARTVTLLIAALLALSDAAASVVCAVPPEWGLLIGAVGAGLYGLVRTLQKRAAGATWKSMFATTEAWASGMVILASILSAATGVIPASYATTAATLAAILLKISRVLQGGLSGGGGTDLKTSWDPARAEIPVIHPSGPGGQVATERPSKTGPLSLVVLLFGLLLPGRALADAPSPTFGGCFSPTFCAGPSASISLVSFNLATSEFSGGIAPGIGYGVTYTPTSAPWAAVGLDIYASLRLGQGLPNQGTFSLMGHFANYVFLGIGPSVTQQPDGQKALVQWSILGGMGVPLGLDAYRARSAGTK